LRWVSLSVALPRAIHLSVSRPSPLGVAHVAIHLSGLGMFVRLFVFA
jgi:hypothetical protein